MMLKKLFVFLVESNIYISLAAVLLTVQTQIQLGMHPQWHPYLFIIFFATMLEYNLHRLITLWARKDILHHEKYAWLRRNIKLFYVLMFVSIIGFFTAVFFAKKIVLVTLMPLGLLTIFYSIPLYKNKQKLFRLREISILKIFLIAGVWAVSTIMLPVIQSEIHFNAMDIFLMLIERMLFVFAITIPFDIRDMASDIKSNLKTIPIILGEKKSLQVAVFCMLLFFVVSFLHYFNTNLAYTLVALLVSAGTTIFFLLNENIRKQYYYHYAVLDGTMFLQGLLVIISYYLLAFSFA